MIRQLEELALSAWAPLQTMFVDGWVLRLADGYTKRANSINPLYAPHGEVNAQIQFCEQVYQRRNLPVVFKMTTAVQPAQLDALLAARGYRRDSPTSVQTLALPECVPTQVAELAPTLAPEWLADFCRMSGVSAARQPTLRQMLDNSAAEKCFAVIRRGGKGIACGLGVLQGEQIGFYDIVTDAAFRNQGYAREVMLNLMRWGKQNGARHAYLQVMQNNAPALHLYARLGFTPAYEYWYRIRDAR